MSQKIIKICSPVMDMSTVGVWQLFSSSDWSVSDIYNKMYDAGIAIENQRTGSLLNYCAIKSVGTIKSLEPDLYAKINSRFNNVDFIASFSKNGYYNIAKPKDIYWSGSQHIKAGMNENSIKKLSDRYEYFLNKLGLVKESDYNKEIKISKNHFLSDNGIFGYRDGNIFRFSRSSELLNRIGSALSPITPISFAFDYFINNNNNNNKNNNDNIEINRFNNSNEINKWINDFIEYFNLSIEEFNELKKLSVIHTTWEDYCLYLLNTSEEPAKSIWREKLTSSILNQRYSEESIDLSTIDAINILSEISPEIVYNITDDHWNKEDYHLGRSLPLSGKQCISLSHYPQQSLEKEVHDCIEYILDNKLFNEIEKSKSLKDIIENKFEKYDYKTILTPSQMSIYLYGSKSLKNKYNLNEDSQKEYSKENLIKFSEILRIVNKLNYNENNIVMTELSEYENNIISEWIKRIKKANDIWFKENIHSTNSWKRFSIVILKGDITCKYIGLSLSSNERLIRAKAMQAFSQNQKEKEKAQKEAISLSKKLMNKE